MFDRAATCMPDACFCEAIRATQPAQPANTWSSFAFVAVAMMIMLRVILDRHAPQVRQNRMSSQMTYPIVYSSALFVVGLGSVLFHSTLSFAGQFADVMGMYLIATFILLYGLGRLRTIQPAELAAGYILLNAALAIILYLMPGVRRYVFALLILVALGLETAAYTRGVKTSADRSHLAVAVGMLALGFLIWTLDITHTLCNPASWIQGHAVWHLLGAAAAWQLYVYYRSEKPLPAAITHNSTS